MKRGESFHCSGDFGFDINALTIQRPIETNVDSDEFTDMEYLTEGSNSHIFSARWRGQVVIVKMLQVEKAHNTIALNEFEIEVELLSRLNHSNVIRILGAGTKPRPYIILEKLKDLNMMLGLNNNDSSGQFLRQPTFAFQEVHDGGRSPPSPVGIPPPHECHRIVMHGTCHRSGAPHRQGPCRRARLLPLSGLSVLPAR